MIHGNLDYAFARLHARRSAWIGPDRWRQIGASRSRSGVLDGLRESGAARWIEGIGVDSDAHHIEALLRANFRAHLAELIRWSDPSWRPALQWCTLLVDLPALRHAARTGRQRAIGGLADRLQQAAGADIEREWLLQLRQRLPPLDADTGADFERLCRMVVAHRQRFSQLAAGNGWAEREALQQTLLLQLRRLPLGPIQLLIWVLLWLLDYERVRGELLRLAAMPAEAGK